MEEHRWYKNLARTFCSQLASFLATFENALLKNEGEAKGIELIRKNESDFEQLSILVLPLIQTVFTDCSGAEWLERFDDTLPVVSADNRLYEFSFADDEEDLSDNVEGVSTQVKKCCDHLLDLLDLSKVEGQNVIVSVQYLKHDERYWIQSILETSCSNRGSYKSARIKDLMELCDFRNDALGIMLTRIVESLACLDSRTLRKRFETLFELVIVLRALLRKRLHLGIRFEEGRVLRAEYDGSIRLTGLQAKLFDEILKSRNEGVTKARLLRILYPDLEPSEGEGNLRGVKSEVAKKLRERFALTINESNAIVEWESD